MGRESVNPTSKIWDKQAEWETSGRNQGQSPQSATYQIWGSENTQDRAE
jgi:hypothetical protein